MCVCSVYGLLILRDQPVVGSLGTYMPSGYLRLQLSSHD